MIRVRRLEHQFVQFIPETLQPSKLYISLEYRTAAHICCCGCGAEVVTPLSPTDWSITFDGDSISMWPSVGNWNLPCRSHYVIDRGEVLDATGWSRDWTMDDVARERDRNELAKRIYYSRGKGTLSGLADRSGIGTRPVSQSPPEVAVSDNLKIRRPQDPNFVNVNEPWELTHWCKTFDRTPDELRAAVKKVGTSVAALRAHFGKK